MIPFTDALGNPISVGDKILYPICSGSSSASLQFGEIVEIDPVVLDPFTNREKYASQKKPRYGGLYALNVPQMSVPNPDTSSRYQFVHVNNPRFAYRLRIQRKDKKWQDEGAKITTITNVDRVVVVTSIA